MDLLLEHLTEVVTFSALLFVCVDALIGVDEF